MTFHKEWQFNLLTVFLMFIACNTVFSAADSVVLTGHDVVAVDYFYEAGCSDCARVRTQVLPQLVERFEGLYKINSYDVGIKSNVILLAAYQEKLGIVSNKSVMMVVDYEHVFSGFEAIKAGLSKQIDESIAERQEPGWTPPQPLQDGSLAEDVVLGRRMKGFVLSVVMVDGLLDGLNPCAIASLVFLMSMLAVAKVRGRGLIVMGASFCMASFVAYTALGFGLLRALHLFSGFPLMRQLVDGGMIVLLLVFALFSFKDAWKYRNSGDPSDITLQLPDSIKRRIHSIIRNSVRRGDYTGGAGTPGAVDGLNNKTGAGALAFGGASAGFIVTVLESVCTGQMYVPTLAVVAKSGKSSLAAALYLFLYNLMFILPLVSVFLLTYFGLKTKTLLEWSMKNVVISKVLLGVFFLALSALVWLL